MANQANTSLRHEAAIFRYKILVLFFLNAIQVIPQFYFKDES